MAVVVGEIAEAFIGIEEKILFPFVNDAVFFNAAGLKSDAPPIVAPAHLPRWPQRNQRRPPGLRILRLLNNFEQGRRSIENAKALRTHHGKGVPKPAKLDRPPAVGAVHRLGFDDRRADEWGGH